MTPSPLNKSTKCRLASLARSSFHGVKTLTVTLALLGSFLTPWLNPSQAQAWTGDLPECTGAPYFDWDWKSRVLELSNGQLDVDTYPAEILIHSTNDATASLESKTVSIHFLTALTFNNETGVGETERTLTITASAGVSRPNWFLIQDINTAEGYQAGITSAQSNDGYASTGSAQCIQTARGANYAAGYGGKLYNQDVPESQESCSTGDWACSIRTSFENVGDSLGRLGSGIVNGIVSVFVPDVVAIQAKTDEVQDFFSVKLGMLTYPFEFLADLFGAFGTQAGNCTASSCNMNFGEWYDSAFTIDFYAVKNNVPSMWNLMTLISRAMLVLGLVFLVRHKYMEIVAK